MRRRYVSYSFDLLKDWSWLKAALETGEEQYQHYEPLVAQNPNSFSLSRVLGQISSKSTIDQNARTNHAYYTPQELCLPRSLYCWKILIWTST